MSEQLDRRARAHQVVRDLSRELGFEETARRREALVEKQAEENNKKGFAFAAATFVLLALTYLLVSGHNPFSAPIEPQSPAAIEADLSGKNDLG